MGMERQATRRSSCPWVTEHACSAMRLSKLRLVLPIYSRASNAIDTMGMNSKLPSHLDGLFKTLREEVERADAPPLVAGKCPGMDGHIHWRVSKAALQVNSS